MRSTSNTWANEQIQLTTRKHYCRQKKENKVDGTYLSRNKGYKRRLNAQVIIDQRKSILRKLCPKKKKRKKKKKKKKKGKQKKKRKKRREKKNRQEKRRPTIIY
jgi:hypothetical protein